MSKCAGHGKRARTCGCLRRVSAHPFRPRSRARDLGIDVRQLARALSHRRQRAPIAVADRPTPGCRWPQLEPRIERASLREYQGAPRRAGHLALLRQGTKAPVLSLPGLTECSLRTQKKPFSILQAREKGRLRYFGLHVLDDVVAETGST